jgi:hypothetical protein
MGLCIDGARQGSSCWPLSAAWGVCRMHVARGLLQLAAVLYAGEHNTAGPAVRPEAAPGQAPAASQLCCQDCCICSICMDVLQLYGWACQV